MYRITCYTYIYINYVYIFIFFISILFYYYFKIFIALKFNTFCNIICNFILILLNYCKDFFNYITGRWIIDIDAF